MSDPLATYIHDHLAGSTHAIDLLKAMRDQQGDRPLGEFAAALLPEIESDRDVLRNIADRAGLGSSAIKEAGAWLEEKVSRIKLSDLDKNGLGTFEALEFLQLGIHGKRALWNALAIVADSDQRLNGIDFGPLSVRAENQENQVERWRLKIAQTAFRSVV